MKIAYLCVSENGAYGDDMNWPDHWRIPAVNEVLLVDDDHFKVTMVQWELDGPDQPSVTLIVETPS